jgi:hypothetical protein
MFLRTCACPPALLRSRDCVHPPLFCRQAALAVLHLPRCLAMPGRAGIGWAQEQPVPVLIVSLCVFCGRDCAPAPPAHGHPQLFACVPFGFLTLYSLFVVACLVTKMSRGQTAVQRGDAAYLLLQRLTVLELKMFSCQQGTSRARCPALTACTRPMFCGVVRFLLFLFVVT